MTAVSEIQRLQAAVDELDAARREAMADNARMWWLLREAYHERERPMSTGLAYRIGQHLSLTVPALLAASRTTADSADLIRRVHELTDGVEVNLDEPLSPEETVSDSADAGVKP